MTTAEVFTQYLGLTPESAPWAWTRSSYCSRCAGDDPACYVCDGKSAPHLTATSPLAPEPTPGWLEALVRHKKFNGLCNYRGNRFRAQWGDTAITFDTHPTHAVARALISADPALRSACERAADYNEKENTYA